MDSAARYPFYIGTYTKKESRGIYASALDPATGSFSPLELAADTGNPTFLAFAPGGARLYAVRSSTQAVAGYAVGPAGNLVPLQPPPSAEAGAPCHVVVDRSGRAVISANYHTGEIAAFRIGPDGALSERSTVHHEGHGTDPVRQACSHPHSCTISPDNRFAIVCDLGLDRIFIYRLDPDRARLEPAQPPFISMPPASGPRHFAFSPDGHRAYAISEMGSTLTLFAYDRESGALTPRQTVSTLPAGYAGQSTGAEIVFHPSGRFLYGSNRGHDSIVRFAVDPKSGELADPQFVPCGGKSPRHFALTPDAAWIVCAHQESNNLSSFRVDAGTGSLTAAGHLDGVSMPVCVVFRPRG